MTQSATHDLGHVGPNRIGVDAFERVTALILLATPALFALLTFQPVPDFDLLSRRLSLPVRCAELIILLIAIRDGFSVRHALGRLSLHVRLLWMVWIASIIAAAAFASNDPAIALLLGAGSVLHAVLALALYDRLRARGTGTAVALMRASAIGLAGYACAAVFCLALATQQPDFPWHYFSAGVTNVRQIGFFGLPLIGISLGLLPLARAPAERRGCLVLLGVGMFIIIWCGGRATMLGAAAAIMVAIVLSAAGSRLLLAKTAALATAIATPIAQALAPTSDYGLVSLSRLFRQAPAPGIDGYSSSRLQFWEWTLEAIMRQPLLGHGEGQFAWMIHERIGQVYNHPHNVVLQTVYEWGFLGAFALAALVIGGLWKARRLRGEQLACAVPALAGLAGLATTALLDGSLYYPMPILSAIMFWAIIMTRTSATVRLSPSASGFHTPC